MFPVKEHQTRYRRQVVQMVLTSLRIQMSFFAPRRYGRLETPLAARSKETPVFTG